MQNNYLKLANVIKTPQQGSPDQTVSGSLKKGDRWNTHTLEAIGHLRRCGYNI